MLKVGSEVTVMTTVDVPFMKTVEGTVVQVSSNGDFGWLQEPSGKLYWVDETQIIRKRLNPSD